MSLSQLKNKKRQNELIFRYENLSKKEKEKVDEEFIRMGFSVKKYNEEEFFEFAYGIINKAKNDIELKYCTYGFECPDINKLKTKEEKDNSYNRILNLFQEQLKDWIYK